MCLLVCVHMRVRVCMCVFECDGIVHLSLSLRMFDSSCLYCHVHMNALSVWMHVLCGYMNALSSAFQCHPKLPCLLVCAGEMEVVHSRSEAAMCERDPLSQPVHCE